MKHIEQLHLEAIQKDKEIRKYLCENDFLTSMFGIYFLMCFIDYLKKD
jgi:hypothetical protein